MPRTKGAKNKIEPRIAPTPVLIPKDYPILELGIFGNEEMVTLVNKVNEIIKRLNK